VRRRPGLAATTGLLVFGIMAAGFAAGRSESLRAATCVVVTLVLPAYLLDPLVGRHFAGAQCRALRAPLTFLVWLSILALWTGVFTVAGATLHVYTTATMWLFIALFGAFALAPLARSSTRRNSFARPVVIAMTACALFAVVTPQRLTITDDSLDHIGYVRSMISSDSLRPAGVLAAPADTKADSAPTDPRKGALHGVMAFESVLASSEPLRVWRWFAVIMFSAAALAIYAFNGAFLSSRAARAIAAVLILVSFHGNPFRFAAASANGESVAALWCWVMTASVMYGAGGRTTSVAWMLLACGGVLAHIGVAAHVLVLVATVACFASAWNIPRADAWRLVWFASAGVAIALLLRVHDLGGAVNVIHAHLQGVLFVSPHAFVVSPMEILRLDGMLFLGGLVCIPFLILAARHRGDARAVLAAAAVPFVLAFVPVVTTPLFAHGSYMVSRSLLNVPAYAAIVIAAQALGAGWRKRRLAAWAIGAPAALVWLLFFARPIPGALVGELGRHGTRDTASSLTDMNWPLVEALKRLPTNAVILSDPATSYALSAVTSQRYVAVYGQHGNPRDPFALERLKAVRDVLSPYAMPSSAVAACRRFGVGYVIVNGNAPTDTAPFMPLWSAARWPGALARMRAMGQAFSLVDSVAGACIYRFEPRAPVSWVWDAQDQPVRVAAPALSACEITAPGGAYDITGVSVTPDRALPGDTMQVTLGYFHPAPSQFGLPTVVHVRFDHELIDRGHEYPGEKFIRRLTDRRSGLSSRFRADLVPGHGVYEPDLWPVGFKLCETFSVVVPPRARPGRYAIKVAVEQNAVVPNFHVRDLLFNDDHYSGRACAAFTVVTHITSGGGS